VQQTTIERVVEWRGIGLHGGRPARVAVVPAPADAGLVFLVAGARGDEEIRAHPEAVVSTARATTLAARPANGGGRGGDASGADVARVATVEHLLAALFALGVHNARIEVEGGEIPVLDGSAAPFAARLREAGLRTLAAPRRVIAPARPFRVGDGERWIRVEPGARLSIDYAIDFAHPAVGRQRWCCADLTADRFGAELAPARTFGFSDEVERLRAAGLARGGDLENTLVIGEHGLLGSGGLRFPDELVRHKVVDLLGDLALLGSDLAAHVVVERGGHGLHHALVRALVAGEGRRQEPMPAAVREALAAPSSKAQPG